MLIVLQLTLFIIIVEHCLGEIICLVIHLCVTLANENKRLKRTAYITGTLELSHFHVSERSSDIDKSLLKRDIRRVHEWLVYPTLHIFEFGYAHIMWETCQINSTLCNCSVPFSLTVFFANNIMVCKHALNLLEAYKYIYWCVPMYQVKYSFFVWDLNKSWRYYGKISVGPINHKKKSRSNYSGQTLWIPF